MYQELNNIDLSISQREEITTLLKSYLPNTEVWAYGSRVKFTSHSNSDLDIVVFASAEQRMDVFKLKEAFEESTLSFRVDLFIWDEVPEQFRQNIQEERVVLQRKKADSDNDWKEASLTELYVVNSGLSKAAKYFGAGYPFLAFKDVLKNYFLPDNLSQKVQSTEVEQRKYSINKGDVFLTRTSETMHELGMSSVALKNYPLATFNGFTKRLRPMKGYELVPEYVGYYLRSRVFRDSMLAFSTMSTRASLNNEMISHLRISYPSISEQKKIARVLKALDDKIELNCKMNSTLESMAQALFKSWFVDFDPIIDKALAAGNPIPEPLQKRAEIRRQLGNNRKSFPADIDQHFPSSFVFSEEMGWIPEGWIVSSIGEETQLVGGGTPSTKNPDFWIDGHHAWVTPKDLSALNDKVLLSSNRFLTTAGLQKISSGLLPKYTVLMSSRAPVGYLVITQIETAINQGFIAMKCNKKLPPEYIIQWANSVMDTIKQVSSGSTFAEISKRAFKPFKIIVPSGKITNAYKSMVTPIYMSIADNVAQNNNLSDLRDLLLPKLISGELRVPELQQIQVEDIK